ncbi:MULTISPECIES: hypothetical protein [unclassified Ruminococcus]|uniref:hypothetical protein n=3 Tax=Ruminococcus TaxID=1263 RepID=UPI00189E189F|nr:MULTISPECIES: hypothetical protein [unclassified Ruminococcus]MDB8771821.1 hypothetical protein [Ruminococcus sp. 1001136sp1]MDB8783038.1 hypothetical protein [Ruminococcus sp. 1001136sp1]
MNDLQILEKPGSQMYCRDCYCKTCLRWWSDRCVYGKCWDDFRAKENPYNKIFPDKPPRTGWSNWNKPGEQDHWCRGGAFYPERKCEHYVEYTGCTIEDCIAAPIQLFQDGFLICTLKDSIGCEACIAREEGKKINDYACEFMTDTGCERMFTAKSLILQSIMEGNDMEPCREQCCMGCKAICGFRCGQAT